MSDFLLQGQRSADYCSLLYCRLGSEPVPFVAGGLHKSNRYCFQKSGSASINVLEMHGRIQARLVLSEHRRDKARCKIINVVRLS
jgi:hypothetical protein